jgi:hypothetical protein
MLVGITGALPDAQVCVVGREPVADDWRDESLQIDAQNCPMVLRQRIWGHSTPIAPAAGAV